MDCTKYFEQIELLDSRGCPDSEKRQVISHLDICSECRQYYQMTSEIDLQLKEEFADIEISQGMDARIKSRVNSLARELEKKFDQLLTCLVEHSEKDFHSLIPDTFHQPESEYTREFLSQHPLFKLALSAIPFTGDLIGIRESNGLQQTAMGVLYRFEGADVLMHAFDCRESDLGCLAENNNTYFRNDRINTVSWRKGDFVFTVTTDHPQIDFTFSQTPPSS